MGHDVELESGVIARNPMRVVPNVDGSEFIFTLIRQPDMSDGEFSQDKLAIEKGLETINKLLEI